MTPFIVVLGLLLVWLAWTWNRLVALRAAMQAAWASIDALLKRRADLIPQLVAVVRGTMDYEATTLTEVTEARAGAAAAEGIAERERAEQRLEGSVRQLIALVESYPELRANESALKFQQQLTDTENDIAMARRYYNAVVRDYNVLQETVPTAFVARPLGFTPGTYFELDHDGERAVPSGSLERDRR
jgi:LemA protein